jgi:hypothetical protein
MGDNLNHKKVFDYALYVFRIDKKREGETEGRQYKTHFRKT